MRKDRRARLDVEADRRFVEQQQPWPVEQGAGDFHPPHLAARQVSGPFARAVGEAGLPQDLFGPRERLGVADAVQGGMIDEVLADRNVGVERRDWNTMPSCSAPDRARAPTSWPNIGYGRRAGVETGDQRKKRRLAGAVQAEKTVNDDAVDPQTDGVEGGRAPKNS